MAARDRMLVLLRWSMAGVVMVASLALPGVWSPAVAARPSAPAAVNPALAVRTVDTAGPTLVTESITEDTTWGPQGSPYVLDGSITVRDDVSLTILPGTVVKATDGDTQLFVRGQLLALGEPGKRVVFTSLKDDSVGGDTNGDGDASTPAPGDWLQILIQPDSQDKTVPMSVIDYADIRYGGHRISTGGLCNDTATVSVVYGGRLVLSNSKITDSQVSAFGTSSAGTDRQYAGLFNNEFSGGECGIHMVQGSGDIVGNKFSDDFTIRSVLILSSEDVRFWFNDIEGSFTVYDAPAPTRAQIDFRFNTITGPRVRQGLTISQLADYSLNWWGRDLTLDPPATDCVTLDFAAEQSPPLATATDLTCPTGESRVTGYDLMSFPALAEDPGEMPLALAASQVPMFGPVDTFNGKVKYSATDLVVQDAGKQIEVSRTFDPDAAAGDLGATWRSSYSEETSSVFGPMMLTLADGASVPFPTDPSSAQTPTRGVIATGTSLNGISTVTTPDRTTMSFDGAGELSAMFLGDPEHRLDIDHDGGKVSKVTGVSGRFVDYDRSGGKLREVSDSQGRSVSYGYDDDGRLDEVTGVDGKTTTYEYAGPRLKKVTTPEGVVDLEVGYDAQDRVSWVKEQGSGRADIDYDSDTTRTITLASGATIRQKVDDAGRLVSERTDDRSFRHVVYDGEGRVVADITGIPTVPTVGYGPLSATTMYDKRGNPRLQIDGMGRGTTTRYNSDHQPIKVTDSAGNVTTYDYDGNGRLTSMVDSRSGTWTFVNNGRGQRMSTLDPAGREVTALYNSKGDRISDTNEYGGTTAYDVDARGQVTEATDPLGRATKFQYTSWGQLKRYELPRGGSYTSTFDDDRRVASVTDPLGHATIYGYDTAGRLTTVTDPDNGQTRLSYDSSGRVDTVEDPRGHTTEQTYTDDGLVASTTNAEDETTTNTYDPAGRLLRVTDPLGRVTQTVYDRAGKEVKVLTPDGATRTTTYDANGNPAKTVAGDGGEWTSVYDATGNITKLTDPLSKVTNWTYDAAGRIATRIDPMGATTTYTYSNGGTTRTATDALGVVEVSTVDRAGQTLETFDAGGHATTFEYNADGQVVKETTPGNAVSHYDYDLAGNRTSQTTPAGGTTTATYDNLGRVETKKYPDTTEEHFDYDDVGNLLTRTDRRGNDWTYTYDDVNRVLTATDPLQGVTNYAYDDAGQQTKVTDPSGVWTETAYDPAGRPAVVTDRAENSTVYLYDKEGRTTKVTDPANIAVTSTYNKRGELTRVDNAGASSALTYTYDSAGNRLTQTRSSQTYTWTYDTRGRVSTSKDARGNITSYGYDATGNRTSAAYPDSTDASWTYDAAGRVKSATDGADNTSHYDHDLAGNVTSIELPGGGQYDFEFDTQGRMENQTDPEGHTTSYDWYPTGQLHSTTKPSGITVESTYDELGRQTVQSAGTATREFDYDPAGRLLTATDGTRTLEYGYDARGLLDEYTEDTGSTSYARDGAGKLTGVTAPTGTTATFGYNSQGLMSTMRGTTNLNFTYDGYGQLTSRSNVSPTKNAAATYGYDLDGNTTSLTFAGKLAYTASYDQMSRATTVTKSLDGVTNPLEGTNTYAYDDAGRLDNWILDDGTTSTATDYGWDPDSNRISETTGSDPPVTSTYDDAGRRLADSDGTTYAYDDDGNLTGIDRATGDDLTLAYNGFGELTGATVGATAIDYELDPLGRTAARDDGTAETGYSYDAISGEIASITQGSTATALVRDVTGAAVTAKTGSTLAHLGLDLHGDRAASTTNTSADLSSTAIYDPFGAATTTGTTPVPLGFQSDLTDPATGLVDMGAREYLPETGAFTAPDTVIGDLASAVTLNRYTYAWADPINMFDPDGHWPSWSGIKNAAKKVGSAFGNAVKSAYNFVNDHVIKPAANAIASAGRWATGQARSIGGAVASAAAQARAASVKATKAAKAEIAKISRQVTAAAGRIDASVPSNALSTSFSDTVARIASRIDTNDAHLALAALGLIPVAGELADGADAVLYLLEGDTGNALLSAAAMLPIGGQAAGLAKLGRIGDEAIEFGGRSAANSGDDLTRVGRWMSPDEHAAMVRTREVQVGGGGTTYVSHPPSIDVWRTQTDPGNLFVEFDVPRSVLRPGGQPGHAQIPSPSHGLYGRLAEKTGEPLRHPVPACNIVVVGSC